MQEHFMYRLIVRTSELLPLRFNKELKYHSSYKMFTMCPGVQFKSSLVMNNVDKAGICRGSVLEDSIPALKSEKIKTIPTKEVLDFCFPELQLSR